MFRKLAVASGLLASPRALQPQRFVGQAVWRRWNSSIGKIDKPTYQLTFTCKACSDRSSHLVSKQAYHGGTVLIQCPSCKNRHLICDHLQVFGQGKTSFEDILAAAGQKVTKADLSKADLSQIDLSKLNLSDVGDIELEPPQLEAGSDKSSSK